MRSRASIDHSYSPSFVLVTVEEGANTPEWWKPSVVVRTVYNLPVRLCVFLGKHKVQSLCSRDKGLLVKHHIGI